MAGDGGPGPANQPLKKSKKDGNDLSVSFNRLGEFLLYFIIFFGSLRRIFIVHHWIGSRCA
jgi:hypothetical protein